MTGRRCHWFAVFADFCSVNTLTMANPKLSMWTHWMWSWGLMLAVSFHPDVVAPTSHGCRSGQWTYGQKGWCLLSTLLYSFPCGVLVPKCSWNYCTPHFTLNLVPSGPSIVTEQLSRSTNSSGKEKDFKDDSSQNICIAKATSWSG